MSNKDQEYDKMIDKTKKIALGDDDIHNFFPKAKILTYDKLKKYQNIDQLLPKEKDYIIILYLNSKYSGHWIALMKDGKTIEFFDSYGGSPDSQLSWNDKNKLESLGVKDAYLTNILNNSDYKVVHNKVKYQKKNSDIKTCGRHISMRILNFLKVNVDLENYNKLMEQLKKDLKLPFDDIVTGFFQ